MAAIANDLLFYEKRSVDPGALLVQESDWYGSLSGGQRSKADFIRTVFLKEGCPALLLVDEGFAALDPRSKALVQHKLKDFCRNSLVLAIYHTDAEAATPADAAAASSPQQSGDSGCVPGGFFDLNLHFQNGTVTMRPLCS